MTGKKRKVTTTELSSETKEKIFLVIFLIFAIIAIILLFKNPTGHVIIKTTLDKPVFNVSEYLKGNVKLQLQPEDRLPGDMKVVFIVTRNVTPCQTAYVCANGKTVQYRNKSNCEIIDYDPESTCCSRHGACINLVKDGGFERSGNRGSLMPDWRVAPISAATATGLESIIITETENSTYVSYIDTSDVTQSTSYSIWQPLLRPIKVSEFSPSFGYVGGGEIQPAEQCKDTDPTNNLSIVGICSKGWALPLTDHCNAEGKLVQCSCVNNTPIYDSPQICPANSVCSNGACVACFVSADKSNCTNATGTYGPSCFNDSYIANYSCVGNACIKVAGIRCPFGLVCSNGKCVKPGVAEWERETASFVPLSLPEVSYEQGLKFWMNYETVETGCAAEVVIKGNSTTGVTRRLHYYYNLGCAAPADNATDKYIRLEANMEWVNYSYDFYKDWTDAFGAESRNDTLYEIWLTSHGKYDAASGSVDQKVYFDDVKLTKWISRIPSSNCGARGKKCCLAGTGLGEFYGEQLECPEGYECWQSCSYTTAEPFWISLTNFVSKSKQKNKYNKSYGYYSCTGCINMPYEGQIWLGGEGKGYTACLDTTVNKPDQRCKEWDNSYDYNLSKAKIKAPAENGSYLLTVQLRWTPPYGTETVFYETSVPFSVGAGGAPSEICTPNWVNCTNITRCDASTNYVEAIVTVCEDENACGEPCPSDVCVSSPTNNTCPPELRPCEEEDYTCDPWSPALCSLNATQTRTCELVSTDCNATAEEAVTPATERDCTEEVIKEYVQAQKTAGKTREEVENSLRLEGWSSTTIKNVINDVYGPIERPKISMWVWIIIVVVLAAALVLVLMLRKKKKVGVTKKVSVPPEMLSYIRDATAAGATKAEIATKLIQAGWPREQVDAAMKTLK